MHIHGNQFSVQAAEFSAISNGEVAARRSAEVRKRLLKSAQKIAADAEKSTESGGWMDAFHSQVQSEDEYHGGGEDEGPKFG